MASATVRWPSTWSPRQTLYGIVLDQGGMIFRNSIIFYEIFFTIYHYRLKPEIQEKAAVSKSMMDSGGVDIDLNTMTPHRYQEGRLFVDISATINIYRGINHESRNYGRTLVRKAERLNRSCFLMIGVGTAA
jgi:hypothetical protein